jgi:hypothetical protein
MGSPGNIWGQLLGGSGQVILPSRTLQGLGQLCAWPRGGHNGVQSPLHLGLTFLHPGRIGAHVYVYLPPAAPSASLGWPEAGWLETAGLGGWSSTVTVAWLFLPGFDTDLPCDPETSVPEANLR